MRIVDLLSKDSILLNASPKNKAEAIDLLVDLQVKGGKITDREAYKQGILAREENGSTAVGEGIAIPHAKNAAVKAPSLAAMTVPEGVDYEALDDEPSNLLFMIAAPSDGGDVHLEVLSRLMVILMDEDFRAKLLAAESKEAFLQVIDEMEREKYPDEPQEAPKAAPEADGRIKVLAVTACPTGIAHTYMAAEALEKAGKKLGISIKKPSRNTLEMLGRHRNSDIRYNFEQTSLKNVIFQWFYRPFSSNGHSYPVSGTGLFQNFIPAHIVDQVQKSDLCPRTLEPNAAQCDSFHRICHEAENMFDSAANL